MINNDVPEDNDSNVHRNGRTGRAGNIGQAITLVTSDDIMSLYEIEEHIGALITEAILPTDAQVSEKKAEAISWIAANSNKVKSSATVKPAQKTPKPRQKQTESHTQRDRAKPVYKNDTPTQVQVGPVYTAVSNPIKRNTMGTDKANNVEGSHIKQETKSKNSFIMRIIQRILGK